METAYFTNKEVEITSVYFRGNQRKQRLESYPKKMIYDGKEYSFIEGGIRYLVNRGHSFIKLFDVSDGNSEYRLRLDEANHHWTLVGIKSGS